MDEVAEWLINQGKEFEKRETAQRLHKRGDDVRSISEAVNESMELVCEWLGLAAVTA